MLEHGAEHADALERAVALVDVALQPEAALHLEEDGGLLLPALVCRGVVLRCLLGSRLVYRWQITA